MTKSLFSAFDPVPITNYLTGEIYLLNRLDHLTFSQRHMDDIVAICNENKVYEILFQDRLNGKSYTQKDAEGFVEWATSGWEHDKYYVFLVLDSAETITAAIDIKTNTLDGAEIGYWCSANHRGIMTNTVAAVTTLMQNAGFNSAEAYALVDNIGSQAVLKRNGFERTDISRTVYQKKHIHFVKKLNNS